VSKIHTDLLWREINRTIGLRILDAGAGTGRFSLPLAQAGHHLTHLDISPRMLDAARGRAEQKALPGITFVEGTVDDLFCFHDYDFDLVPRRTCTCGAGQHGEAIKSISRGGWTSCMRTES
jgi:ubiquinone/menaquinone biosynthesis C-methylase UbiE